MDVKINDYVVTPRFGKVVEVNALWYNALKTLENLAEKFGDTGIAENCKKVATKHKKVFNKKFYNEKKKSLYDCLGNDKIRPNQLFAFSTTYPVWNFKSENTLDIFETIETKLVMKHGLRTLAKTEKEYIPEYSGDSFKRDMSYHQGISWPWLLGLYFDALKNLIKETKGKEEKAKIQEKYNKFVENTYNTFKKEINEEECVLGISEVYDSKTPYKPGGTCNQAWSVSEVLRIVTEYGKNL
jgi:glycogen debranching enzyme